MSLSRPDDACFCTCCCLSDDPEDSNERPVSHGVYGAPFGYNRRYDCTCRQRWPVSWVGPHGGPVQLLATARRLLLMRSRDLGAPIPTEGFDVLLDLAKSMGA